MEYEKRKQWDEDLRELQQLREKVAEQEVLLHDLWDSFDTWRYHGGLNLLRFNSFLKKETLQKLYRAVCPEDPLLPWWIR